MKLRRRLRTPVRGVLLAFGLCSALAASATLIPSGIVLQHPATPAPKPSAVWCWWYDAEIALCSERRPESKNAFLLRMGPNGFPIMTPEMMSVRPIEL